MERNDYKTRRGWIIDQGNAPWIVCLCGSTKFKEEFQKAAAYHTTAGRIVLTVASFHHADEIPLLNQEKSALDELHLRKIDLADEVIVINVNGYVGDSTKVEIEYALAHGVPVRYLEEESPYAIQRRS